MNPMAVAELPGRSAVNVTDISNLGCTVVLTEEHQGEEKQNLNVILVPESILQALRNSACTASRTAQNNNLSPSKCAESLPVTFSDCLSYGISNDCVGGSDAIPRGNGVTVSPAARPVYANNPGSSSQIFTVDLSGSSSDGTLTNGMNQYALISDNKVSSLVPIQKNVNTTAVTIGTAQEAVSTTVAADGACPLQETASDAILGKMPITPDGTKTIVMSIGPDTDIQIRPAKHSALSGNEQLPLLTYKCMIFNCKKTFNSFEELEKHRNKHQRLKLYQCPHPGCPWSFKTPYKLKRHMQSHEKNKQYQCKHPGCDVVCSTSYNLKSHEKNHQKSYLKCDQCDITFRNKHKQQKHLRQVHQMAPKHQCVIKGCDKKLHSRSALIMHINSHSNPKTEFVCTFEGCGKKFRKLCMYKDHIMSQHTNIRPFECDFPGCKWTFTTMAKLKRHQMIHTSDKRFSCPVENCKRTFYRLEHLKVHLRVHSPKVKDRKSGNEGPELPIESNEDNLVYYLCPYEECGSLFMTLVGAKQHIQKIHGSSSKQSSKNSDSSPNDATPVSITLEAVLKSDSESDAVATGDEKISVIVTADSPDNDKESNELPKTSQDLPNLLTTIMTEPSTSQCQDAPGSSDQQSASRACFSTIAQSLNFASIEAGDPGCTSVSVPDNLELGTMPEYTLSSPLRPGLDTSHYLLDSVAEFAQSSGISRSLPNTEPIDFMTMSPHSTYTASSSADRFLNFADCVPTVDPNVVMSVASTCMDVRPAFGSPGSSSSCEGVDEASDGNNNKNRGGSARTDCNAYRRACMGKRTKTTSSSIFASPKRKRQDRATYNTLVTSPMKRMHTDGGSSFADDVSSFMLDSPQSKENVSDPCGLHSKISHYFRDPGMPRQISGDRYKAGDVINLREQDFAGSTINLSDLA